MRISKVHEMVLNCLNKYPESRSDDAVLQCRVIEEYFDAECLYQPYIITINNKQVPSIESVGRARRRCQARFESLRADSDTEAARMLKEEEYREYAKSKLK